MKKLFALILALTMVLALVACGGTSNTQETPTLPDIEAPADTVLQNGTIQTMVAEDDTAEALAIRDGEIVYVGTNDGITSFIGESTKVIDLDGAYVTPGFVDGHIHYAQPYLVADTELDVMNLGGNLDAYIKAFTEFVAEHPDLPIYRINGMDLKAFPSSNPTNDWLDEICPDKPVISTDVSLHGKLMNTSAIELMGITKDTPNPDGGTIYKDADGNLTGYFSDCLFDESILPAIEYSEEQYVNAFLGFQDEASSYGITTIDGGGGDEISPEQYNELYNDGILNLRVNYNFFNDTPLDPQSAIDYVNDNKQFENSFLNVRQTKLTLDGVPEGKTSYLLEPYAAGAEMPADYCGSPCTDAEDLNDFATKVNAAGITFQIHAMGDASVRMALDSFEYSIEQNGEIDVRNKITHLNLITEEDVPRMAEDNIIAAMQPMWFYYDPFFSPLEEQMLGKDRFDTEYHIRDLMDAGITITGSLDYPVTYPFQPLLGIEAGATQCSPYPGEEDQPEKYTRNGNQVVSVYEMLKVYTVNGAYGAFMDDRAGTIEVGKRADLVVLGQNLLTCDVKSISDTPVLYTFSDGRIVYQGK